jgi:hypothetical protein
MFVRIESPLFQQAMNTPGQFRPIFRYLMTPIALIQYVLAGWRLGADLQWTGNFFIERGLLSHWQVWLALAIVTQATGSHLHRMHEQDAEALPASDTLG